MRACVCVCVCVRERERDRLYIYIDFIFSVFCFWVNVLWIENVCVIQEWFGWSWSRIGRSNCFLSFSLDWFIKLHSVPRIVALITMLENMGTHLGFLCSPSCILMCALIFSKFLHLKYPVYQSNMQNLLYWYFWLSLTHTVGCNFRNTVQGVEYLE